MAPSAQSLLFSDLHSSGRLWAYSFVDGVGRAASDTSEIAAACQWTWSHFSLSDNRSRLFIESMTALPDEVRTCLLGGETRVQTHVEGAWCYGVLPDFAHELGGAEMSACRLNFAFDAETLFTTRRHPLQAVDGLRRDVEHTKASYATPPEAVASHVARFIDLTERRLVELEDKLNRTEDHLLSDRDDLESLRLGPIRRELSSHHREFAALRSAFHRASSHRAAAKSALVEHLPPLLLEIEDFDRDLSGLQDRARLLHDEIETRVSAAANRSLRALTILSTLLLPPTLVVGAFGMNVPGVPFAERSQGFWAAATFCVVIVLACYWALRRMRIL